MHDYQATGFRRTRLTMEELTSLRRNHIILASLRNTSTKQIFSVSLYANIPQARIYNAYSSASGGKIVYSNLNTVEHVLAIAMEELTSYKSDKIIKFGNSTDASTKQASSDSFNFINIPQARICVIPQGQEIVPAYSVW